MKILKKYWWAVPIMLAGFFLMFYPSISERLNSKNQSRVVENVETAVRQTENAEIERIRKSAQEFNALLLESSGGKYGEIRENLHKRYAAELDMDGSGVMGYIHIPAIEVRLPIGHGTSDEVMSSGAAHVESSSLPIGGKNTHAVISAHRGLPSSLLFTYLDKLKDGDEIYLHILDEVLAYRVDSEETILPSETGSLDVIEGEDRLTLLTCTPYGQNTHRLLVHAGRVAYSPEKENSTPPSPGTKDLELIQVGLFILWALLTLLILTLIPRYYRKKKEAGGKDR